ncbi:MAG: hypothetical protein HUJ27_13295 [Rhodobacteraceae bacterium]|nr:hypothetical protein [Paracoccaceae bacterium]
MKRAGWLGVLLLAGSGLLAACAPVSPEQAAIICAERARSATGPTGTVGVGIGTGGPVANVSVGITQDYLLRRDPYEVYHSCVRQKTGQDPIRPLEL